MGVEGKQQNVCKHMDLILQGISFSLSLSSFFFSSLLLFILFYFHFHLATSAFKAQSLEFHTYLTPG